MVKRLLELVVSVCLLPFVALTLAVLFPLVLLCDGRPFLYRSDRMKSADCGFSLYKIRTMRSSPLAEGVLGGDQRMRVTRLGRVLRLTRLDELPQIFNILKGDMGFIGPRPPLRRYVSAYPDLYRQVLRTKPGVTGLATVLVHRREEQALSRCRTAVETDALYCETFIPMKAWLDLQYAAERTVRLDMWILWQTVRRGAADPDLFALQARPSRKGVDGVFGGLWRSARELRVTPSSAFAKRAPEIVGHRLGEVTQRRAVGSL